VRGRGIGADEHGAELRGLLGAFDRHGLRLTSAGDERLNLLAYAGEAPLGAGGLELQWNASASRSERPIEAQSADGSADLPSICDAEQAPSVGYPQGGAFVRFAASQAHEQVWLCHFAHPPRGAGRAQPGPGGAHEQT
jgi:hypothetical protein